MNISDNDTTVDTTISSYFKAESQDTSRYDTDAGFTSCLNAKVEQNKFGATIGSKTKSSSEYCIFLGQNTVDLTSEDLKKSLYTILDKNQINAFIKAIEASQSKGVDAKIMSKLCG